MRINGNSPHTTPAPDSTSTPSIPAPEAAASLAPLIAPTTMAEQPQQEALQAHIFLTKDGKIVMSFGRSITWIGFDPVTARAVASSLIEHADLLEGNKNV